jgi:TetR/AcrR family transcriptional regulator, transcriptional repressor for nem operon
MPRTREFDDETAVRAARELFWERGYVSTSLLDLQEVTRLSRSSMYAAYGSKRGLFERAALSYLAEVVDPLLGPMEAPGSGAAEIAGFFLAMAAVLRFPNERLAKRGCFMINTLLELDELDAEASDMVSVYRARVHRAVLNAVGAIEGLGDHEARAGVLTVGHLGVMTMARIAPVAAAVASETIAADVLQWTAA